MTNLERMNVDELRSLRINIDKELEKRKRVEYDKALKKFFDALEELYSNFPFERCFTDDSTTWEDLRENYDWNF